MSAALWVFLLLLFAPWLLPIAVAVWFLLRSVR